MNQQRTITFLLLLLTIASFARAQSASTQRVDSLRVLFLGNSHTFYNDMPQLATDLAASMGKTLSTQSNTPGGHTLNGHSYNSTSLDMIAAAEWDHVILQEQSQIPVIEHWREQWMRPAIQSLDSAITHAGASTILFMIWGKEEGGAQCISDYCSPDYRDFFEMQSDISTIFYDLADEEQVEVAPIGDAWALALEANPQLSLWNPDHSHPSLEGSYLGACVLFCSLFGESPVGAFFTGGLPAELAAFYQSVAFTLFETSLGATEVPEDFALLSAHPNPFNPAVTLDYTLTHAADVELAIFNMQGQELAMLRSGFQPSGSYRMQWQPEELASGLYFVQLKSAQSSKVLKLSYLK
jgi:hypothetical protein